MGIEGKAGEGKGRMGMAWRRGEERGRLLRGEGRLRKAFERGRKVGERLGKVRSAGKGKRMDGD